MYNKEFYARYDFMSKFTVIQENIPHQYFSRKISWMILNAQSWHDRANEHKGIPADLHGVGVSVLNSILIDVIGFIFIREINLIYYQSSCTIMHYSETHNLY